MNKSQNVKIQNFALLVFFSGLSIGSGMVLYLFMGFQNAEKLQFNYFNAGLFPLLLGFVGAFLADRKYQTIRGHQVTEQ